MKMASNVQDTVFALVIHALVMPITMALIAKMLFARATAASMVSVTWKHTAVYVKMVGRV